MLHHSDQPITGTILVADDQAANRELLEELLTTQGFKVIAVPDGAAALQELSRAQADLVLLDVMMPHLDGVAVMEQLRPLAEGTYLPVLILTADVGAAVVLASWAARRSPQLSQKRAPARLRVPQRGQAVGKALPQLSQ